MIENDTYCSSWTSIIDSPWEVEWLECEVTEMDILGIYPTKWACEVSLFLLCGALARQVFPPTLSPFGHAPHKIGKGTIKAIRAILAKWRGSRFIRRSFLANAFLPFHLLPSSS